MSSGHTHRCRAILTAFFVTFLWSTSWVLIKFGLQELPPLFFAGLRYSIAALCLLPIFFLRNEHRNLGLLSRSDWKEIICLGIIFYAIAQGAQFFGLKLLPAMSMSLLLNLTSVVVTFLGIAALAERPMLLQWAGLILSLIGLLIYFGFSAVPSRMGAGVLIALAGMTANSISTIISRKINKQARLSPLLITTLSMSIGSILMLAGGIYFEGVPFISLQNWLIIFWMAIVNTALAFTLWNLALRDLQAMQISMINGTMVIQIALLAWVFLGEKLTVQQIIGMVLVGVGTLLVQMIYIQKKNTSSS